MVVTVERTEVSPDRMVLDGQPVESWIESLAPGDAWFRMLQGRMPEEGERRVFDGVLVALTDHGSTPPSTQAARLVASAGVPLQAALAGGLLAFGDHHAGAIEGAMALFQGEVARPGPGGAAGLAERALEEGIRIPGFGHRVHRRDPRVVPLKRLGEACLVRSPHLDLFCALEEELSRRKDIGGNVDGVCGALLSDLGFPPQAGRALFFAGRLPGLTGWILRETRGRAFRPYALVPREGVSCSA